MTTEQEQLLKEAKQRYPPGTVFRPAHICQTSTTGDMTVSGDPYFSGNDVYIRTEKQPMQPLIYRHVLKTWATIMPSLEKKQKNFKFQIGNNVRYTNKERLACNGDKSSSIVETVIINRKHFDGYIWYLTSFSSNWVTEEGLELINKPEEDLLAEAARRYPIGTEYIDVGLNSLTRQKAEYAPKWVNGNKQRGNIEVGIGYVRCEGKWAEIVKEEKPIEQKKEFPYKIDDWMVVSDSILGSYPKVLHIIHIEKWHDDVYKIFAIRKDGTKDWFNSRHIERLANIGEMEAAGYKPTPISNALNEAFGMRVGDVLFKKEVLKQGAEDASGYIQTPVIIKKPKKSRIIFIEQ